MFRAPRALRAVVPWPRSTGSTCFISGSATSSNHPNSPLDLDPSLRALLKDVDISLINHRQQHSHPELQAFPTYEDIDEGADARDGEEPQKDLFKGKKSPAAYFGSLGIGAVIIPPELRKAISLLISDSDKHQLRYDAKRLFHDTEGTQEESRWEARYDVKYRSRRQAARHSERDATAFASVALPAHYSAIYSVLDHVKTRLGPDWKVESVIDWGAGTGSGLWATLNSFQKAPELQGSCMGDEPRLSQSSVLNYVGLDKRERLVSAWKRLLRDVDIGPLNLRWQKSLQENDEARNSDPHTTLALSAFLLSSLQPLARKALVKEMWESGAHVMILIDHNTSDGFDAIAQSREYLLNAGRKENDGMTEVDGIQGSHVVAPCPHDGECPLYNSGASRHVCGFSQRLQRPPFVRLTKHSGVGYEDIGYSYVVVRRGPRPVASHTKVGRIGDVGKREMEQTASQSPLRELRLHDDEKHMEIPAPSKPINPAIPIDDPGSSTGLLEALRQEAFSWPRLVFPPLKRSGHIILDSCTAEGKIMRITIPKSQGKQPFYDARKSSWGDIFPHEPKNPPHERFQSKHEKSTEGKEIVKRRGSTKSGQQASYAASLKNLKKERRRDRIRARNIPVESTSMDLDLN